MELSKFKSKSMGSFYYIDETDPESESLLGSYPNLRPSVVKTKITPSEKPKEPTKNPCIYRSEPPKEVPAPKDPIFRAFQFRAILQNIWKLIEITITFILALIIFPILGSIIFFIILPARILISWVIWLDSLGQIKILSPLESFKASGSEFYTIVHIIRGDCDMEKIRNRMERAVHATRVEDCKFKYPNLRKRLVKRLGLYCLEDKWEDFNIRNHVKLFNDSGLSDEHNGLSQFTLFYLLQDDFESSFFKRDEPIPQWEVLVIPRFYYKLSEDNILPVDDERRFYAVVYRANSSVLDKNTALKILQDEIVEDPYTKCATRLCKKFTRVQKITLFFLTIFLGPWHLLKNILRNPKPLGDFRRPGENGTDSIPRYLLKSSYPINIASISAVKDLTMTTVTSALTCFIGAAARNMILGYNLDLPREFWVTFRSFLGDKGQESISTVELESEKYSFPLERLHDAFFKVGTDTASFFLEVEKRCNLVGFWIAGLFPARACKKIYKWIHRTNFLMEIWPGVSDPFMVFGMDLVADIFGWVSIAGSSADFGVTITSYAGRMRANFVGDNEALGYHTKRTMLPNEFMEEYLKIAETCHLKPSKLFRPGPFRHEEFYRDISGQ